MQRLTVGTCYLDPEVCKHSLHTFFAGLGVSLYYTIDNDQCFKSELLFSSSLPLLEPVVKHFPAHHWLRGMKEQPHSGTTSRSWMHGRRASQWERKGRGDGIVLGVLPEREMGLPWPSLGCSLISCQCLPLTKP